MYTSINGMRSARYPLQGCGCDGLGQTAAPGAGTLGAMLPILGLGVLVIGVGMMASGGSKRAVSANRRRRRR